jgi:HEAT repeat protein
VLIEIMNSGVASVRRNAAAALGQIGPEVGDRAVVALTAALGDTSFPVREQVVIALGKLTPLSKSAIPVLQKAVESRRFSPRVHAAYALWSMTGEADRAVPALVQELKRDTTPWEAAEALGRIGAPAKAAVGPLTEALKTADDITRWRAAEALGRIGPASKPALPTLIEMLEDPDPDIRTAASEAISKVDPSSEIAPSRQVGPAVVDSPEDGQ